MVICSTSSTTQCTGKGVLTPKVCLAHLHKEKVNVKVAVQVNCWVSPAAFNLPQSGRQYPLNAVNLVLVLKNALNIKIPFFCHVKYP